MSPPFQQQGQGYNSQNAGHFPMTMPEGSFQTLSTADEDEDYAMSAYSGIYGVPRPYQNRPQYLMEDQLQGSSYSECLNTDDELAPQPNNNGGFVPSNLPFNSWIGGPDAWNTAGPSRQNSLEINQQLLEQIPGNDLFAIQDDLQWTLGPSTGYQNYAPLDEANHAIPLDPAAPLFPNDPNATDYLEPNQGLRNQPGGHPYYSPNIELPLPSTGYASQTLVAEELPASRRSSLKCQWPDCGQRLPSKAAFKKHMARHEKPEICPYEDCERGFAARVDLERHCDSVHKHDLDGNPTQPQMCPADGCFRLFPQTRRDNLKQHLINKHHIEKEMAEDMIPSSGSRSNRGRRQHQASHVVAGHDNERPSDNPSLPPLGGSANGAHLSGYQRHQTSAQSSKNDGAYFVPSSQPTATRCSSQELDDVQDTSSFSTFSSPLEKQNRQQLCYRPSNQDDSRLKIIEGVLSASTPGKPRSLSHSSSLLNASFKPSLRSFASAPEGDCYSMDEDLYSLEMSVDEPQAEQILHALEEKYDFVEKGSTIASVASTPAAHAVHLHPPNCKGCLRWKDVPHQRKKHMKRKAKPYFCPEDDCDHDSGSKNDQMRHHNSQHVNLEKFVCEIVTDGRSCGKQFNHSGSLVTHLTGQHRLRLDDAKEQVKRMRIVDENFPGKFWCGICQCWLGLQGAAEARRDAMFNHIEDHLEVRNGERYGTAEDWRPQHSDDLQIVEKVLCVAKQAGSASKNRIDPGLPAGVQQTPARGNTRPQPAKAFSSADHKRHSSASPSLRPHMTKKLKSDCGLPSKAKENDAVATKPHRGAATVATITYTCCGCFDFGAAATGLCRCGHQYNECCQQTVVRQPSDEFDKRGRRRQGRCGDKEGGGGTGHTMYRGFNSRSAT